MRRRTQFAVVLVAAATAVLAGCGPKSDPTQPPAPQVSGTGTAAATPTTGGSKVSLPTNGSCVLIDSAKATTLIGAAPKSSSAHLGNDPDFVHVDGCTHISPALNLGYDVNDFTQGTLTAKDFITQATAAMSQQPGVTPFTSPGGDASIAFTVAVGPKTMARIETAQGPYSLSVNVVGTDPARCKQVALAAMAVLVAAVQG